MIKGLNDSELSLVYPNSKIYKTAKIELTKTKKRELK
jgi:hypothetical protein